MERCRNCGDREHLTRECDVYGPMFLEPGKTREDYRVEHERIQSLLAADVVAHHEAHGTLK